MKDGAPVVTWSPALNGEGDFRFFRVTVEMP